VTAACCGRTDCCVFLCLPEVAPIVSLVLSIWSCRASVAPLTTCLSCSGVRPKLQLIKCIGAAALGDCAQPRLDLVSESDRRLLPEGNHGGRARERGEKSGARHGFGDGAAGGGPQFTVLPVAVPLFAMLQSPDFTLVPAEVIAANILSKILSRQFRSPVTAMAVAS